MSAKSKVSTQYGLRFPTQIHSPKCWFTKSQLIESNFLKRYPGDKCVILSSYQSILIELCVKLKSGHLMRMLFDFEFWNPCWRQMRRHRTQFFSRWLRELTRKSIQQIVNLWLASNQLVLHVPTVSYHSARVRLENKINKLRVNSNKTSASVSHSLFHLISDFGKLSTSIKTKSVAMRSF